MRREYLLMANSNSKLMALAAGLILLPGAAFGQGQTGSISGALQTAGLSAAPFHAPLGAVRVVGSSAKGQFSTTADSNGHFSASNLPAGSYIVSVSGFTAEGVTYRSVIIPNVEVKAGQTASPSILMSAIPSPAAVDTQSPLPEKTIKAADKAPQAAAKPALKSHPTIDGEAAEIRDLHKLLTDLKQQLDGIRSDLSDTAAASP